MFSKAISATVQFSTASEGYRNRCHGAVFRPMKLVRHMEVLPVHIANEKRSQETHPQIMHAKIKAEVMKPRADAVHRPLPVCRTPLNPRGTIVKPLIDHITVRQRQNHESPERPAA